MTKLYDESGDEVEGAMTKEEFEAQKNDAIAKAVEEALNAEKEKEKLNKEHPAKADEQTTGKTETTEPNLGQTDDIALLKKQIEALSSSINSERVGKFADKYSAGDPEKAKLFQEKYERLTGYEDTPDGISERAADAARLAGLEPASVDIGAVSGTGTGRDISGTGTQKVSEADKAIRNMLGISEDDAKKYGGDNGQTNNNK